MTSSRVTELGPYYPQPIEAKDLSLRSALWQEGSTGDSGGHLPPAIRSPEMGNEELGPELLVTL